MAVARPITTNEMSDFTVNGKFVGTGIECFY